MEWVYDQVNNKLDEELDEDEIKKVARKFPIITGIPGSWAAIMNYIDDLKSGKLEPPTMMDPLPSS